MNINSNPFWPKNAFRFGGGGSSGASTVAATPVPVASPPVTASSAEVEQAKQDLRRQALKKRGFSSTVHLSGDGGWMDGKTAPAMTNPQTRVTAPPGPGAKLGTG